MDLNQLPVESQVGSTSNLVEVRPSCWNPTTEQIEILKRFHTDHGNQLATPQHTSHLHELLLMYSDCRLYDLLHWFENKKVRDQQKDCVLGEVSSPSPVESSTREFLPKLDSKKRKTSTLLFSSHGNSLVLATDGDNEPKPKRSFQAPMIPDIPQLTRSEEEEDPPLSLELSLKPYSPVKKK